MTRNYAKMWTWQSALQDHVRILQHLHYFFITPFILTGKQAETTSLSVNSANKCPYCTGLHGELGRINGVDDPKKANETGESDDKELQMFANYGSAFGRNNGRGDEVKKAYDELVSKYGKSVANAAEGVSYTLLWGSLSGNTINSFLFNTLACAKRERSSFIFELLFTLWYGFLFCVIKVTSWLFSFLPEMPRVACQMIAFILGIPASIFIVPFAILGMIGSGLLLLFNGCDTIYEPLPPVTGDCKVSETPSEKEEEQSEETFADDP